MVNFQSELKKLNKAQRLAVETIEGPVMVVAGPGTGKTQVLTLRIANILKKTDTPPESVLALTFTESAAASMRQRLVEIMGGSAEAYKVSIKTIHGFCNEVIQNYPEEFSELSGTTNITEVDQIRLVRKLLDLREYPLLRSFGDPYRNVRDIISAISDLKREGKSPKEFEKIVAREEKNFEMIEDLYHEKGAHKGEKKGKYQTQEKQIARLGELSALYAAYQIALRKQKSYDYDDMIMEVAAALKTNKALRYTLQERYLYLLVDEHQDTNQAQNRVIELLASLPAFGGISHSPNLFVVGDEKQAIYRFQGASIENFTYFQKRFKSAKVITLTDSYRSHQTILDAAFDVALKKGQLKAEAKHLKKPIQLVSFSAPDVENYFLTSDIARKIKDGTNPKEIAVLYRDNKDSVPIARMLEKLGVPFSISSDEDILQDYDIKKLLLLFEAVRNFGKDYALIPTLYIDFLKIAPLDVAQLLDTARQYRESVFTIIRDKKALQKVVPESAESISELYEKLSLWKAMSKNDSPLATFEAIVRDSGFLASMLAHTSADEGLTKVHALFDELKSLLQSRRETMFDDFLEHLDLVSEHRIRLKLRNTQYALSSVQLMTAHKAKGMEFEVVYITNAIHTHWGSRRNRDLIKLPPAVYTFNNLTKLLNEEGDGEERNIFYVALTRAKKEVIITYSEKNAEGRAQLISEFAANIRPELVERADTEKIEQEFAKNREIEFAKPVVASAKEGEKEHQKWVQKRFLEKGLSVSALNNYLECPNKFYFLNLVGLPEAPNKFALFGNAAHAALKFLSQEVNAKRKVTKLQFLKYFERALGREPIGEREFEDMVAKGGKGLAAYFDAHVKSWPIGSFPEYSIRGVKIGPIEVRGQLDRIDCIPRNTIAKGTRGIGDWVRVVDYKTGRVKTRNEIAGKTINSDANFYRQLTFYKLLIERGTAWKMAEGEIDFIEPDAKGNFKREVFAPSDAEVKELEKEIKRVSAEILKGEFKGCGEKDCRYCELRV